MKILLYGYNGWIGNQLLDLLKQDPSISLDLGQTRIDDIISLTAEIDRINPTHIISFTGRTHGSIGDKIYTTIDYLEQPGKLVENLQDNLYGPVSLALECNRRNIHYTYLGTGCIFTDTDSHTNFSENDIPNFTGSSYSTVKGFTDRLFHQMQDTVLNLRIRMPIVGYNCPRNFITKILTYDKICSISNSMSVLPDLLPLAISLIKRNITGTINLTNPGTISHNEILELYTKHVDPTFTWKNFTIEDQRKIIDSERSNNKLDTTLLESFFPDVPPIKDSIQHLFQHWKS